MSTNDLSFPKTTQSQVFSTLWQDLLDENIRELKYTAQMAGTQFSPMHSLESMGFMLFCYNEEYQQFFANVFSKV